MNEHDVDELLRQANVIDVTDLPDPRESPEAERLLASILDTTSQRELKPKGQRRWPFPRHRLAVGFIAAVVCAVAAAVAFFPGSSHTSNGLSTVSAQGTQAEFSAKSPRIRGLGTPYVLAEIAGKAFFRVERKGSSPCYGSGKLVGGKLSILMVDCTPFPSEKMPVLSEDVGVDASNPSGGGKLLFAEGFAADGVAEIRLVDGTGHVVSAAPVKENVFRLEGVAGLSQSGLKLIAVNREGNEVWSRVL